MPRNASREVRLYVEISSYVVTGNRAGFDRWAKLNNLKEAARTFNYLSENNLLNYEDFQQHMEDVSNAILMSDQKLVELDAELTKQKVIQKHCDIYRICRKVIEDGKKASNPKSYKSKHQSEYQLHDTLKQELHELGITKLPSQEQQKFKISNLENERSTVIHEKQDLQKRQSTLQII